jgi:hypothetical protein
MIRAFKKYANYTFILEQSQLEQQAKQNADTSFQYHNPPQHSSTMLIVKFCVKAKDLSMRMAQVFIHCQQSEPSKYVIWFLLYCIGFKWRCLVIDRFWLVVPTRQIEQLILKYCENKTPLSIAVQKNTLRRQRTK